MKKITLKLTPREARALRRALLHEIADAKEVIETAAKFPESNILREAAEQAEDEKAALDELDNKLLEGLSREQWNAVVLGEVKEE